jgi:NAD(P)H-hydrate epimerase
MIPVVSAEEMRLLDQATIDEAKVPGRALMELAADGIVKHLEALQIKHGVAPTVLILVGSGNNGGDGLVIARRLFVTGWDVSLVLSKSPKSLKGDALGAWESLLAEGFDASYVYSDDALAALSRDAYSFIIDTLLGTGTDGEPRGAIRELLSWQASLEMGYRIAVDIPSGLHSETGRSGESVFEADETLAIGLLKRGHVVGRGPEVCGLTRVLDIGFSDRRIPENADYLLSALDLSWLIPPRPRSAHKGTMGHVLAMVGSPDMPGAGRLVVDGALQAGAGLVTWWVEREALELVGLPPSALWMQRGPGVQNLPERTKAWVCGSGFAKNDSLEVQVMNLFSSLAQLPWVLDAKAMSFFADWRMRHMDEPRSVILTPHPLELARLINASVDAVESDRRGAAVHAATLFKACVVLKGPGTVVASPEGQVRHISAGNPGMARGGMGDVLAGVIGALLAQGLSPFDAASAGALWHAVAGDSAADELGESSVLPSALANRLGAVLDEHRSSC